MTTATYPSYKDRDRVLQLERQVEDLKLVTGQQQLVITRLRAEAEHRADKIAALVGAGPGTRHATLTASGHLRNIGSSNLPTRPLPKTTLDPTAIRDSKLQQLTNEVMYWKRHFNMAESKIADLIKEKNRQPSPLKTHPDSNITDTESLYLKKLLEENLDLKMKIDKMKLSASQSLPSVDIIDQVDYDSGKENDPIQATEIKEHRRVPPVSIKSNSQRNVLKPRTSQMRAKSAPNVTRKAAQAPASQPQEAVDKAAMAANRVSFSEDPDLNIPHNQGRSHGPPPQHVPAAHPRPRHPHPPPSQHILRKQVDDLTNQNRCLQSQVCQLRGQLERRRAAACSCAVASSPGPECGQVQCLRRQVHHLQHQLQHWSTAGSQQHPAQFESSNKQLDEAKSEISKLEDKCDALLEQKKGYLEKISGLQKQVDTLLSSASVDTRVKELISKIESQRDAYKYQVKNLIKDLQEGEKVVVVERDVAPVEEARVTPPDVTDGRVKKTIQSRQRSAEVRRQDEEPEDVTPALELLQVRARLADTAAQLDTAQREAAELRQEVAACRQQLQLYTVKQTQTSPSLDRERRRDGGLQLQEAVQELKQRIIDLELENSRLAAARAEQPRQRKSSSLSDPQDVVDAGIPISSGETKGLQDKVKFLENQLDKTEDSLRNCQNLMSENSKRTLELNSQIMKLKQEEMSAKKNVDDLQLKLDKKDEVVRRIVEDKDKLLSELNDTRQKLQESKSQVHQKSELLTSLDRSKDTMDGRIHDLEVTVKQLERAVAERERRLEEVRSSNQSLEEENRNVKLDNGSLRVELDLQKSEVERLSDESRGKSAELGDIRAELQRYITEVKRVEELLLMKESDRTNLLTQYEELSKEVTAFEATNRTLEMQAANLVLEVRSREDDLVAAKQRCDSLETYVEEVLRQNEEFRLQVSSLTGKVDVLTSDLKSNRVTRDGVISDLESVNQLAVRLNSEKIDLVNRISNQNQQVETLQEELVKLREDLLGAMGQLEEERHRARTLQRLVTSSRTEDRETVIRSRDTRRGDTSSETDTDTR